MSWLGVHLLVGATLLMAATATATVLLMRRRMLVVTVEGLSMARTLRAGERLLVRRVPVTAMKPGQVVVLDISSGGVHPGQPVGQQGTGWRPSRFMIKRLAAMPGDPVPQRLGCGGTIQIGDTVPPSASSSSATTPR